jgi:hypothetical protein
MATHPASPFFATDDQRVLLTESVPAAPVWRGGIAFDPETAEAWVETGGTVAFAHNGLRFTIAGALCVFDASGGIPAGAVWANGLPFTSGGLLCIDAVNAFSHVQSDIPFTDVGAVYVTFDGPPPPSGESMITEDDNPMITEDGDLMVTE